MFSRYDLSRALDTLIRVLVLFGQKDNADALTRRKSNSPGYLALDELAWWIASSPYGSEVWAEITGGIEVAVHLTEKGTSSHREARMALEAIERLNVGLDELVRRNRGPVPPPPGVRLVASEGWQNEHARRAA